MDWLINVLQSWIKDVTDEFDTLLYATYCILNNYLYQFLLVVDAGSCVCLDSRLFMRVLNPMVFLL